MRTLESTPQTRKTSPPPQATSEVPPAAKQAVDQRYGEFARDNPDADPFKP